MSKEPEFRELNSRLYEGKGGGGVTLVGGDRGLVVSDRVVRFVWSVVLCDR